MPRAPTLSRLVLWKPQMTYPVLLLKPGQANVDAPTLLNADNALMAQASNTPWVLALMQCIESNYPFPIIHSLKCITESGPGIS